MTNWRDMSMDNAKAAKELVRCRCYRSAVSRSYYAGYAMVTHRLVHQGFTTFGRFQNPSHADVAAMALNSLAGVRESNRRTISRAIRVLRMHREDADYRPHTLVDAQTTLECARLTASIFKAIGEPLDAVKGGAR